MFSILGRRREGEGGVGSLPHSCEATTSKRITVLKATAPRTLLLLLLLPACMCASKSNVTHTKFNRLS